MAAAFAFLFLIGVVFIPQFSVGQVSCTGPPELDLRPGRTGIRRSGVDTGAPDSLCFADFVGGRFTIDCFGVTGTYDNRSWYENGVRNPRRSASEATFTRPGNYTCVLANSCGRTSFPVLIPSQAPRISDPSQSMGITQIGISNLCVNSSSSGIQPARLACNVSNPRQSELFATIWSRNGNVVPSLTNMSIIGVTDPGLYVCRVRNDCGNDVAGTTVEVHPTIIKGSGRNDSSMIDIGTDSCLGSGTLMIFCNVVGNIRVTRRWFKNGVEMQGVTANKLTVMPSNNRNDNYTCTVRTTCSSDTATTIVIRQTEANITAMITASSGAVGTGCNRIASQSRSLYSMAQLCPRVGENVTISCASSPGSTYVITGPGGRIARNSNLVVTNFQANNSGIYLCNATSICDSALARLNITAIDDPPSIPACTLQQITTPRPGQNASIPVGCDVCLLANQTTNLTCNAMGTVLSYRWTRNGVFISTMQNLVGVSYGTYICTAIGVTANASSTSRVIRAGTVSLTVTSNAGSRCRELTRPPQPNVDFCAFLRDRVTFQCTSSVPGVPTRIFPGGEMGQKVIPSARLTDTGLYTCNGTSECGVATNMTFIRVYIPARIIPEPEKTLPVPQPGEIVVIAGQPSEPVCGRDGNKISLHCCFTGTDNPIAQWHFVYPNGTGVLVTSLNDSAIMVMLDGQNLILMINPFRESHIGKYCCNVTNIAGNGSSCVDLIYKPPEDKQWSKGPWSACSPDCHRGVRTRTVVCVTASGRMVMDGCNPDARPPSQERCLDRGPCARWVPTAWTQCSVSCGGGFRFRNITCRTTYSNAVVNNTECPTTAPRTFERCNNQACPCSEPNFCRSIKGTELCWNPTYNRICCCTCGPANRKKK